MICDRRWRRALQASSTPRPELRLVRPRCLGQLAVAGDPGLVEHVRVAFDRAEERVPFAFELPVEEPLGEPARIGVGFAAGGEVELLEPFPDLPEFAARVVDVLAGRLDPAKGVLAEGDDLGSVAAAEQLLDGGDDVVERLREPVRFVPGDEAAGVHGNVEGMLELAEARCGVQARAGRLREQARMQVLVVERLLDEEVGERLRAQRSQPRAAAAASAAAPPAAASIRPPSSWLCSPPSRTKTPTTTRC